MRGLPARAPDQLVAWVHFLPVRAIDHRSAIPEIPAPARASVSRLRAAAGIAVNRDLSRYHAAVRIVSLVPAGTEILFALGVGDHVVAVSHECDYPAAARHRPRITSSVVPTERLSSAAIDAAIRERVTARVPLYHVDTDRLSALGPTMLVTQSLCDVCALPAQAVHQVRGTLPNPPALVSLEARSLAEILESIVTLGEATGTRPRAQTMIDELQGRIARVRAAVAAERPRRVVCLEWLDPPYSCGHWIPEMVRLAGGIDAAGREGIPSVPTKWDALVTPEAELVVALPCGYSIDRTVAEMNRLARQADWGGRLRRMPVYVVDSAYFTRPGPRVVDGIELLASLFHPTRVTSSLRVERAVEWAVA